MSHDIKEFSEYPPVRNEHLYAAYVVDPNARNIKKYARISLWLDKIDLLIC